MLGIFSGSQNTNNQHYNRAKVKFLLSVLGLQADAQNEGGISDTVTSELSSGTWPSVWLLANKEQCESLEAGMCSVFVRMSEEE